ncbi:MAG: LysR family transcriptional regulator [Thermoleophilaceae bacterium]
MPTSAQIVGRLPPTALLDLRRLAMLAEVARRGSFSGAAEAMCFTPSAVSQQMSALARDLGVVLFERTPQGMRLTESADALVAHAQAVFARLGEAQSELEAIAGGVRGRLRFGSFPTATMAFGAQVMETFRDRYTGVELRFADGEPYESVARLKERELDLAVLFDFDHWTAATDYDGRAVCADGDIDCVELFDDPCYVVLPREHPLAAARRVELSDLAGQRVVGSPAECSPWGLDLRELCSRARIEAEFESCYRTSDFGTLQAIVATGRGVTLVPELALSTLQPGVVARPLQGGPVRHVRLATLANVVPSPACRAMAGVVRELTAHRRAPQAPALAVVGR